MRKMSLPPNMNMIPELGPIFYRRSVRQFKDQPLTDLEKQTIIQGAMRAPTAGNMMMYSILEVSEQNLKDQLVKTCDNQPFIAKSPFVLIFLADMQRMFDYYDYCKVPEKCQALNQTYRTPEESDLMLASCDAVIAAQNAVITAEALGISSCYIGDIMENIERHRSMFNLPKWVFPVAMVCFGYSKSTVSPKDRKLLSRFPQHCIHFTNHYQTQSGKDFDEMFSSWKENFQGVMKENPDIENLGQLMYFRKTGADFSKEMARSVKKVIEEWISPLE